jgi:hypothetical protein
MEEVLRFGTKHTNFIKHKEMIYLFTKGKRNLRIYNLETHKSKNLLFKDIIINVSSSSQRIMVFHKNKINIFDDSKFERKVVFVFPNIVEMLYLSYKSYIFFDKDQAFFHNDSGNLIVQKLEYFQFIQQYVIFVSEEKVFLYKEEVESPILELTKQDFCEKFNIKEPDENFWREVYFSIRNNKLYTKYNSRIVGCDLNLYLTDVKHYKISRKTYTRFTNIKNEIIFFSHEEKYLLIVQKNLMKLIFKTECENYFYDDLNEKLYFLNKNYFRVCEKRNIYKVPFTLIEFNIKYFEQEDEFDESNDEINDF